MKRNVELELEAVRALQEQGVPVLNGNVDNSNPDEIIVEVKCDEVRNSLSRSRLEARPIPSLAFL